jgi:restriction system protein
LRAASSASFVKPSERLVDLWIEAYDKLDQKARQRLSLSPIYFLTPED